MVTTSATKKTGVWGEIPNTIIFDAESIEVGADNLCIGLPEEVGIEIPFDKADTLVFKLGDQRYEYKKVKHNRVEIH